ncbi:MAG: proprotein convertase P-domain-containing protein [Bacteroidota bacterium]
MVSKFTSLNSDHPPAAPPPVVSRMQLSPKSIHTWVILALMSLIGPQLHSQCTLQLLDPAVDLPVVGSSATLDAASIASNVNVGGVTCTNFNFFDALGGALGSTVSVNCDGTAPGPGTYFVSVDDGDPLNESNLVQINVSLDDTTDPTFTVPADVTISCEEDPDDLLLTGDVTDEADNCASGIQATYTDNTSGLSGCSGTGTLLRTWTLNDGNGNSVSQDQTITVQDVKAPTFTPPANITIDYCTDDIDDLSITGDVTDEADNCSTGLEATYADAPEVPGSCPNSGTVVRTWTLVDDCNNATVLTQTITRADNEAPSSTQMGITVDNEAGICEATISLSLTAANTSDNCDDFGDLTISSNISGTADASGIYPVGTTNVVFTITDLCGNVTMYNVAVTVNDTLKPVIVDCPMDVTVNADDSDCDNTFSWTAPSATDFCTGAPLVENIFSDDPNITVNTGTPGPGRVDFADFPVGTTILSYAYLDPEGNRDTCTFSVSVLDNQAPEITCPPDQDLNFGSCNGASALVPDYRGLSSVLDNCPDGHTVIQNPAPNTLLSAVSTPGDGETFTVTLIAIDDNPNNLSDTCTFNVTLIDTNTPNPDLPGATLPALSSTCGDLEVCAPTATDNCGNLIVGSIASGATVDVVGSCSAPCTLNPPIVGTPNLPLNDNAGTTITIPVAGLGTLVDEVSFSLEINHTWVGDLSATLTSPSGTIVPLFNQPGAPATNFGFGCDQNNLNLNFSDDATNTADDLENTCNPSGAIGTFAIQGDFQALGSLVNFNGDNANGNWILNLRDDGAGDVGSLVSYALNICTNAGATIPLYNFTPGNYNVTWEYDDGFGNTVSQTQQIDVAEDTEDPVLNCQNITVELDSNGMATVLPNTILGEGIDLSSGGNLSFGAGNADYCVTVNSATSITFNWNYVSTDFSAQFDPFGYTINGAFTELAGSDLANDPASLNQMGTTTVQLNAGDEFCFRASTTDNFPPAANTTVNNFLPGFSGDFDPANWSLSTSNSNGTAAYTPLDVSDNCGVDFGSLTIDGGATWEADCSNVGDNSVTLSIFDINGNEGTCAATITVVDNIFPTLSGVPTDVTVSCEDIPMAPVVTASDNCSATLNVVTSEMDTQTGNPNTCGNYNYTITRGWRATDDAGNVTSATQIITVEDTEAPTDPTYTDNIGAGGSVGTDPNDCAATVSLMLTDLEDCAPYGSISITNDSPFATSNGADASGVYPLGPHNVNFTVTDPCGNSVSFNRSFTVVDDVSPIASCQSSVTIGLPSNGTLILNPALIDNGSFDNCGIIVSRTVSPNTFDCDDADGVTEHPVTLTVVDAAGNASSCNAVVIIEDNFDPTAVCRDITVNLDQSGTATITPADVDGGSFDNCTAAADLMYAISQNTFTFADAGTTIPVDLTVTDSNGNSNTCTAMVTVTVPIPCFNIGTGLGGTNTVVSIPVMVENFLNVLSFQFSIELVNSDVGEIIGVSGSNLPGNGLVANLLTSDTMRVSYFNSQIPVNPVTFADGETIFFVDILLMGNVGDFSTINIIANSMNLPAEVVQDFGSGAFSTAPCTAPGAVAVNQPAMLDIAGECLTENGQGVGQVEVTLTNGPATVGMVTTDPVGDFIFEDVNAGGTYKITPSKNINWTNGVTANDLFTIQRHIVGLDTLNTNYKKIAADVFRDGIITTFDIVQLQTLLGSLGTIVPNTTTSWVFAADKDTLADLAPLFVPAYTECLVINNLPSDSLNNDFTAIKTGDVTDNANPANLTGGSNAQVRTDEALELLLNDQEIVAGEEYELELRARDFEQLVAYQWVLDFDPEVLHFEGYEAKALRNLNELNFGQHFVDRGWLVMLWHQVEAQAIAADEVLYTLRFSALRDAERLSDLLRVDESRLAAEAYRDGGLPLAVRLNFSETTPARQSLELFQNQPNPFREQTVLGFYLPQATSASLQVLDVAGRVLLEIPGDYPAGYHELELSRSELPTSGVLYYRLETDSEVAMKKMIVVE